MDLSAPLAWLVDEAGGSPGADRFLADLGSRLLADGLPLAGGALTLAVPHPIIARPARARLAGRAGSGRAARRRVGAGQSRAGLGRNSPVAPRRERPAARDRALCRGAVGRAGGTGG